MAASGARICVAEGDLRRAHLRDYMGMDGSLGLTNVLIGQAKHGDVLRQFPESSDYVLGSARFRPTPASCSGPPPMIETLRELEPSFEVVIIDTPRCYP